MALFCSDVLLYSTTEWLYSARMFCCTRHSNGSILLGCSAALDILMALYHRHPLVFIKLTSFWNNAMQTAESIEKKICGNFTKRTENSLDKLT